MFKIEFIQKSKGKVKYTINLVYTQMHKSIRQLNNILRHIIKHSSFTFCSKLIQIFYNCF